MGMEGLEWGKGILVSGHGLAMINTFDTRGDRGYHMMDSYYRDI
jgi:hypothetical protein